MVAEDRLISSVDRITIVDSIDRNFGWSASPQTTEGFFGMSPREIRDYVAQAKRDPRTENIEALWRAVFLLKAWYFLPARDDEGPAFPTASIIDGGSWLLAFTNVRRLEEFARTAGREADDGSVPLLVLDPGESMRRILEVRNSIAGVIFNVDSPSTFRAPVEALQAYAEHFDVPVES